MNGSIGEKLLWCHWLAATSMCHYGCQCKVKLEKKEIHTPLTSETKKRAKPVLPLAIAVIDKSMCCWEV